MRECGLAARHPQGACRRLDAVEFRRWTSKDLPEIGIVYDIYHSAVMDERTEDVVGDSIDRIVHVHIADHPGRNEPGTGSIDLKHRLDWLFAQGYDGRVGLEYRPTKAGSEAVTAVIASLDG